MGIFQDIAGNNRFRAVAPTTLQQNDTRDYGFQRQKQLATDQDALNATLMARATGTAGPSVAEAQMQRGLAQGQRQNMSMAASARGGNRVGAMRAAMASNAQMAGDANSAAAMLRAQEQQQAQQLAAQNQQAMQGQNLQTQGIGQVDQTSLLDANMQAQVLNQKTAEGNAQRAGALTSSMFQGGMAAGGALLGSDIRMKENIERPTPSASTDAKIREMIGYESEPQSPDMMALVARNNRARDIESGKVPVNQLGLTEDQMIALAARKLATPKGSKKALAPINPTLFTYKPAAAAMMGTDTGERPGVMAQDIEKSPSLAHMVVDTPGGKMIDGNRAVSALLATAAGMDKRLKKVEAKKRAA